MGNDPVISLFTPVQPAIILGSTQERSLINEKACSANKIEIVNSYPQLSLGLFLENYSKVIVTTPEVYCCASNELGKLLPDIKFRFIHIDGSHLYEHVSRDLALAAEVIHQQQGIIVLDDITNQDWCGVMTGALDFFNSPISSRISPIAIGFNKLFISHFSNSDQRVKQIAADREIIAHQKISPFKLTPFGRYEILSLHDLP